MEVGTHHGESQLQEGRWVKPDPDEWNQTTLGLPEASTPHASILCPAFQLPKPIRCSFCLGYLDCILLFPTTKLSPLIKCAQKRPTANGIVPWREDSETSFPPCYSGSCSPWLLHWCTQSKYFPALWSAPYKAPGHDTWQLLPFCLQETLVSPQLTHSWTHVLCKGRDHTLSSLHIQQIPIHPRKLSLAPNNGASQNPKNGAYLSTRVISLLEVVMTKPSSSTLLQKHCRSEGATQGLRTPYRGLWRVGGWATTGPGTRVN